MSWLFRGPRAPEGSGGRGGPFCAAAARVADRLVCVAGAVALSQVPEFFQQYLQRLDGRLDEARSQLEHFRDAASASGLTVDALAATASADADPAIARLGGIVRSAAERVEHLAAAVDALRHATAFSRPFAFLAHVDLDTVRGTLRVYRPAVPTTAEGFVYALVGLIAALAAYRLILGGVLRALASVRRTGPQGRPKPAVAEKPLAPRGPDAVP